MKKNQLKTGVIISFLNLALGNIIPFVYTPIMLRILGQAEYGLYGIAQSVMGYLQLLNFGVGGTIVRYIAKYHAEGNKENEEAVIGLFVKLYTVIAILIFSAGMIASYNVGIFRRSLSADEVDELAILVRLMSVNASIFLPFSVFSSIIIAHEQYIFHKLVSVGCTVITPILNLIMLFHGSGAVGLVVSTTLVNIVSYSLYLIYSFRKFKLYPKFSVKVPGLLKEIVVFSFFVFLESIVDTLYWATDKLIIGWSLGTVNTAIYNIGATFNGYVTSLSTAVSSVLVPKVTNMAVKNASDEEYTELFVKIGRLQFIIISFVVSAFVAFGRQFIAIWAGTDYMQSYYVALLVMIPVTVPLIQNTGYNILYALNKHRFRSLTYLGIAILNVALTMVWVESWGIIGAAMATCVAYVIGNIIIINWYYYKIIGINIPLFWKNILKMCPVMIVMGIGAFLLLDHMTVDNWSRFFILAIVYSVIYVLVAYRFMMNHYERDIIIMPLKKMWNKIKKIKR